MKNKNMRTIVMYVLVALLCIMVVSTFMQGGPQNGEEINYADFLRQVKSGNVSAIMYSRQDRRLYGLTAVSPFTPDKLPSNFDFFTNVEEEVLHRDLAAIASVRTDIPIDQIDSSLYNVGSFSYAKMDSFSFLSILPSLLLLLSMGLLFFWFARQQGGGNSIQSFGKSKARVVSSDTNKVTFADVAGADEEKAELVEVIDFLKSPERFRDMGARIPKGVLLMGPPGTGKTLLAKAVAGEAGAPFYSISGSDFVEMYVGVGASRVRDLFATAKKNAPAIIFIDEIDAVGRQRGAGLGGGHDEREQTLNQLLVEMDGFDPHAGIIVIAATNRSDILDPALLRPGRFDRQIVVNRPDVKGREEILKVHAKGKPLDVDVNLGVLAQRTPGFTGADLENVLNESAILAVRNHREKINMYDVEEAITRVIAGPQKKSRVVTPEDQRITAYHEAGHAIVSRALPGTDSVHEISIIQRGMAAGYTMTLPDKEAQHMQKSQLEDQMAMLLSGRVAEEIFIGDIATGASDDIKRATGIAQKMVTEWGMSEAVGTVYLGNGDEEVFLGRDIGSRHNYSDKVESLVDSEVNRFLANAKDRSYEILSNSKTVMEMVTAALLQREHLSGFQFENLCQLAEGKIEGTMDEVLDMVNPEEEERQRIVAEARKAEEAQRKADEEARKLQQEAEAEARKARESQEAETAPLQGKTYIRKEEPQDRQDDDQEHKE